MLEKGAKSHTTAASTGKIASPRDHAVIVTPIMPDGSYPHHCRGIASVTSQISDVTMTYRVVTANAGQFVRLPMARYRSIAGRTAPAEMNRKYVGKFPFTRQSTSAARTTPAATARRGGDG